MSSVSGVSVQAQYAVAMQAKVNSQAKADGQATVQLIEAAKVPSPGHVGSKLDVVA